MSLPESSSLIYCQNCGSQWDKSSTFHSYWFRSASLSIGSYSSPADIVAAAEDMTFCPHCPDKGLQEVSDAAGDLRRGTGVAEERFEPRETASKGDADFAYESPFI